MTRVNRLLILIAAINIAAWAAGPPAVRQLRITKEIPGFRNDGKIYRAFSAQQLYEIINGGAPPYIQNGLVSGIHQQLNHDSGRTIELFVEDFGTPHNANDMFLLKKTDFMERFAPAGEDTTQVIAAATIGALLVVCIIDKYYFEITLGGYADQGESLKQAKQVVDYYRERIRR
jgi:hypothetical protein